MGENPGLQPLPLRRRRYTFFFLVLLFVASLPILYLYAAGYRFNLDGGGSFVSTGGIYISADKTGAAIYINDELVRETRTFRRAFYAQGIEPGTHRVHVQKEGHHTWVKELPVYPYLVTEALAFNMPEVPQVRTISPWKTSAGETVVIATSSLNASTTNDIVISARVLPAFVPDTEYASLLGLFASSTTVTEGTALERIATEVSSFLDNAPLTSATTTQLSSGVLLFESGEGVFAGWVGPREQMPYYYCAEDFEFSILTSVEAQPPIYGKELIGPVQHVPEDVECEPVIEIDRGGEKVHAFDFYPGSTDLVLLARSSGVYVVEIDNRAWQNTQPLIIGEDLDMRTVNGTIYVYDGRLIYQVLIEN